MRWRRRLAGPGKKRPSTKSRTPTYSISIRYAARRTSVRRHPCSLRDRQTQPVDGALEAAHSLYAPSRPCSAESTASCFRRRAGEGRIRSRQGADGEAAQTRAQAAEVSGHHQLSAQRQACQSRPQQTKDAGACSQAEASASPAAEGS